MKILSQLGAWWRGDLTDRLQATGGGEPDNRLRLRRHNFKSRIDKMSIQYQREQMPSTVDQPHWSQQQPVQQHPPPPPPPAAPGLFGGVQLLAKFPPKQVEMLQRATSKHFLNDGSFQEAVGPLLALAQCFAIMPLRGVRSANVNDLHFTWRSIRTIYAAIIFVLSMLNTILTIMYMYTGPMEFVRIVPVVFYVSNAFAVYSFGRLAMQWPRLMKQWQEVERQLPRYQTQYERGRLAYDIKMLAMIILLMSLIENLLSLITTIYAANKCRHVPDDPIRNVLLIELKYIFHYVHYNSFVAFAGKLLNIQSTFVWTYMDLFVMIISIGLVSRFRQINRSLTEHKSREVAESFWVEHRIYYRNMCDLCETIDREIGHITLVSFSNNLWFICVQLLYSLNDQPSLGHALYFWYSLIFLIIRTLAVSLYSADINDESKEPLKIFRSVPPASWCLELKRFSTEVTRDVVALSGMRFFHLTRTLVLSVAGTIITYELVLVQFNTGKVQADECQLDVLDLMEAP